MSKDNKKQTQKRKSKKIKLNFQQIVVWFLIIVFVGVTIATVLAGILQGKVYAAEIEEEEKKESITLSFSIEEATKYAKENNHDLANLKLQSSGLMYSLSENNSTVKAIKDAAELALSMPGASLSGSSSFESYLLKSNYYGKTIKLNEEVVNKTTQIQEELMNIFVENAYNLVLIRQKEYEDALRNYDVVKKQVETGKIKFDYGNISEIDYKSLELELNSAELSVINAKNSLEDAKNDFKDKLGLDFETEIILTSPLEITKKEIVESEEKNQMIIDKSITLLNAKTNYELAQEAYRYAKAYYGTYNASAKSYKVKMETAELQLKDAQNAIKKSINNTYRNIEVMKKSLEIMEKRVDLMNVVLGLTNIRKDVGMATESDMITASINYNSAKCEYLELLSSYNMVVGMFDLNIVN